MLRLGFVANFISSPVLTGFKAGIGLVIVLDQVPKLLGVHIAKEGFFRDILSVAQHLPDTSLLTLAIAVAALLALLAMERLWPHSPAPLVAVSAGIGLSWLLGLDAWASPPWGSFHSRSRRSPFPALALVQQLLPGALGIALMSFTETIAAGRAFAARTDPPIKANRELLATGAANLAGAFFGAMPAGGGTSQTAVVRAVGGHTQKASLVTAAAAAATMLVLAPLLGLLPQAVLAAIVIVYSVGLIEPAEFVSIRRIRRMEFRWALAAFLGVLVFGTLQGIVVAIVLSLIGLASQAANPKVYVIGRKRGSRRAPPAVARAPRRRDVRRPADPSAGGTAVLRQRPAGRGSDPGLGRKHKPRVVTLDMSRVFDVEYSALQMLIEGERRMTEQGVTTVAGGTNPNVLEYVRASGFADQLGPERLLSNVRAAIQKHTASYNQD